MTASKRFAPTKRFLQVHSLQVETSVLPLKALSQKVWEHLQPASMLSLSGWVVNTKIGTSSTPERKKRLIFGLQGHGDWLHTYLMRRSVDFQQAQS
jgi:hypothetical protein